MERTKTNSIKKRQEKRKQPKKRNNEIHILMIRLILIDRLISITMVVTIKKIKSFKLTGYTHELIICLLIE